MSAIETGLRQAEALNSKMNDLRERLEKHINLKNYTDNHKNVSPKGNAKLMRICLIAGLSDNEKRKKKN